MPSCNYARGIRAEQGGGTNSRVPYRTDVDVGVDTNRQCIRIGRAASCHPGLNPMLKDNVRGGRERVCILASKSALIPKHVPFHLLTMPSGSFPAVYT